MGILDNLFKPKQQQKQDAFAWILPAGSLYGINFDGEQEPGAMNDLYVYDVDYYEMAKRAYTLVTVKNLPALLLPA